MPMRLGNLLATGVPINDGHWHHLVIAWRGEMHTEKPSKENPGEFVLYLNALPLFRGAGHTKEGRTKVSGAAGALSLGAGRGGGGGRGFAGLVASLALFDRFLDAKAVANLFATVLLRGSEKGLVLYYDFDFEATDATPPRQVRNKARRKRTGASVAALHGPARLVLLQAPYQLQKVAKVAHTAARLEPESQGGGGGRGLRGEVKAKCLEFEDGKAEACITLFPAEVVPESKLSLTMWVRSVDRGLGTILSYAAHRRRAFNLRVTHRGATRGGGTEEAQKKKGAEEEEEKERERLIRVDGSMHFMDLLAKLKENFGELRCMWRHALCVAACAVCGGMRFSAACETQGELW